MDEMIRYIFGTLRDTETMLKLLNRSIKKQQSFNFRVAFWMTAATTYIALNEIESRKMRRQLESLKNEIKELKNTEGD